MVEALLVLLRGQAEAAAEAEAQLMPRALAEAVAKVGARSALLMERAEARCYQRLPPPMTNRNLVSWP